MTAQAMQTDVLERLKRLESTTEVLVERVTRLEAERPLSDQDGYKCRRSKNAAVVHRYHWQHHRCFDYTDASHNLAPAL